MECNRETTEENKSLVSARRRYQLQNDNLCLFRSDPNTKQILESMRSGAINIKQAAEALGMEPAMLAYQLAGRVRLIAQLY